MDPLYKRRAWRDQTWVERTMIRELAVTVLYVTSFWWAVPAYGLLGEWLR